MDFGALERDLGIVLKKLPPEFLSVVSRLILAHKDALGKVIPDIINDLQPHIGAAIMENAMSVLDKRGLEETVIRALSTFGVVVPPELTTTQEIAP
jgi:hypothetical protein